MDAKQLQNVITVLKTGSLGRAAVTLNMSQPALTKSIQRLEERLGVPLFVRDSKGMRPTVYGEAFRPHAEGISASMDQALRELETMRSGAGGTVRLAAGPLVSSEILSSAIVRLAQQHPLIRVTIHTAIGDHVPGLIAGDYDFILAQLPLRSEWSGLIERPLVHDRISVIARHSHALAALTHVRVRDLLAYKWILPEQGHPHRHRLARVFETENLPMPVPDIECSSTEFIKSVVMRSDHLGLIAQMGMHTDSGARTVEIDLHSPFMVRPIGAIWRQNQVLSQSCRCLMSIIEDVCRTAGIIIGEQSASPGQKLPCVRTAPPKRQARRRVSAPRSPAAARRQPTKRL